MKDKKTLITIIVLLVIFLPIGVFGTIKSFSATKPDVKDDNLNKEFKYNNKLYFYYNDKLLSTYECSTCTLASSSIDDINYHTNYYKSENNELASVINEYYGLFKENDNIILYNLVNSKKIDAYKSIKNYNIDATSKFAITEKSNGMGVIFFDLSSSPIPNEYEYISLPAHIIDNKLDTSKFIVKKDNMWSIISANKEVDVAPIIDEIVDFNDNYYITYANDTYHVYDRNNIEYLENLPKTNVYGVGKYIFVLNNNQLFIYENCLSPVIKIMELPNYNSIYFYQNNNEVDIMINGNLQETLEL